jgi:ketosteroid isomerase-like protein
MNRRTSIITGLSAVTAVAALQSLHAQEPKGDNPELEKVRAVLKAHDDAMTSHNLEGVLAVLSPKAVIMGTGPGEVWTGTEELKDAYKHFFEGFDKGEQDFTYYVKHGSLGSDMGWLVVSGEIKAKKDGKAISFPMNVSVTVSKSGDNWQIASMHFSTLTSDQAGK